MNIKKSLRRKYLFWKYKHNYNNDRLIITTQEDRGLGLTTMMLEDCLRNNYVLIVKNEIKRKFLSHEIYKRGQLGLLPSVTEYKAYSDYLTTIQEIKINSRGRNKSISYIVDNNCDYDDVKTLFSLPIKIINGFMYIRNGV